MKSSRRVPSGRRSQTGTLATKSVPPTVAVHSSTKEESIDSSMKVKEGMERQISRSSFPRLEIPFCRSRSECKFDLMQVYITIYGMSGISCQTEAARPKFQKFLHHRTVSKKKKVSERLDSKGTTTVDTSVDGIEAYHQLSVPTTAVVSCRRNAFSSSTPMETFLPSLPLTSASAPRHGSARYMANWRIDDDSPEESTCNTMKQSTFTILRAMKRENYHPETKLRNIANYMHETIDLNVFVGRGKELLTLGTASLAVAGDEEAEVTMNIPVKPMLTENRRDDLLIPPKSRRKSRKNTRKYLRNKPSFLHEPTKTYSLAENATLRIGVRVLPHKVVQEASKKSTCTVDDKDELEDLLRGMVDENLLIEIDDEDSFMKRFGGDRNMEQRDEEDDEDDEEDDDEEDEDRTVDSGLRQIPESTKPSGPAGFFCNPFHLYHGPSTFANRSENHAQLSILSQKKKNKSGIMAISFISSVSDSLSDDVDDPPATRMAEC